MQSGCLVNSQVRVRYSIAAFCRRGSIWHSSSLVNYHLRVQLSSSALSGCIIMAREPVLETGIWRFKSSRPDLVNETCSKWEDSPFGSVQISVRL